MHAIVKKFVTKYSTNFIEQAPYSPDMAPYDVFWFPKLKLPLRGTSLESIEVIKEKAKKKLKLILAAAYKICMDEWSDRWRTSIISQGAYFEGDRINFHD